MSYLHLIRSDFIVYRINEFKQFSHRVTLGTLNYLKYKYKRKYWLNWSQEYLYLLSKGILKRTPNYEWQLTIWQFINCYDIIKIKLHELL